MSVFHFFLIIGQLWSGVVQTGLAVRCQWLECGTLEMEVRGTQSYTVAVEYTGQASMDREMHWAKASVRPPR